jgi:UDP-N-acetylmuramate--alanine ligase
VERRGEILGDVELPLRGVHNVVNALGTIAMADAVGVPFAAAAQALARFGGVARRFDIRGVDGGATFVDDYAHLPAEIAAVIAAARESGDGWQRVVVAFQPNRFNRIAEMWRDYADAFEGADVAVITDVYSSGTTPIPGVTGELIVNAVLDAHPTARVVWLPRRADLVSFLAGEVGAGDVCISMGCGDIATLPEEVLARRAERRSA